MSADCHRVRRHGPREGDGRGDHAPFGIIKGVWRYGGEPMTYAIPVIDLENVQLEAVRVRDEDKLLPHAESSAGR